MMISLRLNDNDSELIKAYADMNGLSMSELFRKAVLERIEDEFDLKLYKSRMEEYEKSGKESRPIEELWKELDL